MPTTHAASRPATGAPLDGAAAFAAIWMLVATGGGVLGLMIEGSRHAGSPLAYLVLFAGTLALLLALRTSRLREAAIECSIGIAFAFGGALLVTAPAVLVLSVIAIGFGGGSETLLFGLAATLLVAYVMWGARYLRRPGRSGSTGGRAVAVGLVWPFAVWACARSEPLNRAFDVVGAPLRNAAVRLAPAPKVVPPPSPVQVAERETREALESVVAAQMEYWSDHQRYAPSLDSLGAAYAPAEGVVVTLLYGREQDFAAVARHAALRSRECRVANRAAPEIASWPANALDLEPQCVGVAPELPLAVTPATSP
jgi:hypothetical protein